MSLQPMKSPCSGSNFKLKHSLYPETSFYLGLGFLLIFVAIEDMDCLETGELDFHMAHKPHCWKGGLEDFVVRSDLGLVFIVQFSGISLPSLCL